MKKISVKMVALSGMTAAVYIAVTAFLAPLSFGDVQFRFSEILNLLAFIHPVYAIGVTVGCFMSNLLFSPFGLPDIIIGTLTTGLATLCITKTKSLFTASLWPVIFTIPVAAEIAILLELPFLITALSVMAGEFVVVTVVGVPLFKFVILKNKPLMNALSPQSADTVSA